MESQSTIKKEVSLEGVGLHTGEKVNVVLKPSSPGSGVVFKRSDLTDSPQIQAHISRVIDLARWPRRTSIGIGKVEIQTVEHLMAALAGLKIDNILVEIDGEELPGLDGSAQPFVEALNSAGIQEQNAPREYFRIREPFWLGEDDALLMILPADEFKISYTLDYDHPHLRCQFATFTLNGKSFEEEIAPSRTFCLQEEADELKAQGLGKGANYENTLVVGNDGVIKNELRFEDEFVRHKISDLVGDLYLLGAPIKGHIVAVKSGHPLNIKLLQRLATHRERQREAGIRIQVPEHVGTELDIEAIQKILPHRYPFLMVDRILQLEEKRAVGVKNVSINDNFFRGHFPGRPVMPGVMIVEALAQVGGILMLHKEENWGKLAYFMAMDNVKFRKTVVPGDQLYLEVEVLKLRSKTGLVHGRALVDGKVAAEADLLFTLVEA